MRTKPLALLMIPLQALALAGCFSDNGDDIAGIDVDCNTTNPPQGTRIVRIQAFAFTPAQLTVEAGTRVVWINCEPNAGGDFAHTSTADGGAWSSALLPSQGSGKFERLFSQTGSFGYHCTPHPHMQGTVIVQ